MGRSSSSATPRTRSEEHTSELQSRENLVCRLLLEKKKDDERFHLVGRAGQDGEREERGQETASGIRGSGSDAKRGREHAALFISFFFFFNDTATTEIYTLSLHDALPICSRPPTSSRCPRGPKGCPWR